MVVRLTNFILLQLENFSEFFWLGNWIKTESWKLKKELLSWKMVRYDPDFWLNVNAQNVLDLNEICKCNERGLLCNYLFFSLTNLNSNLQLYRMVFSSIRSIV